MSDELAIPSQFNGRARLFPLPDFVLFPSVIHPLHIFEPRYRQMTRDALAGDRLIAMALLELGGEAQYDKKPAVHRVVCLAKIVSDQQLEDGRFNILLQGLSRARVVEEVAADKLYRLAEIEVLTSHAGLSKQKERRLRKQIIDLIPTWFPAHPQLVEQFLKLVQSPLALGALCDIISFALPLEAEFKQQLLEELDVERRVYGLLGQLLIQPPPGSPEKSDRKFPPEFSSN